MTEKKLSELMDEIEAAVLDAQDKLAAQQEAKKAYDEASKAYSDAAVVVEKLREEFNTRLPVLTKQAVRQY